MIAVLDYGIGNLASAHKALVHLGADARLVTTADEASRASGVVLPGVGAFGACAEALRSSGLDGAVRRAVEGGVPLLGVCVGFQLLYEGSEESPGVKGLGLLAGRLRRLPGGVKRPQMQWNLAVPVPGRSCVLLAPFGDEPAWFYFVHSFAVMAAEGGDEIAATCDYGAELVAVAQRDRVLGTQFHPEKSGRAGLSLLAAFVESCEAR